MRQVVIFRLVMILSVCLVGTAARSAGNQTGPVLVLTFLELRVAAVDRGRSLLRRYEESLRRGGQGVGVATLEEIGRPERFVIVERARRADELAAPEASGSQILASLNELLTAPADRRTHRESTDVPTTASAWAGARSSSPTTEIYVIAHLDLIPPDQASGVAALGRFVTAARRSPGNLRFEAWQQSDRGNHFNLLARWTSRSKLDELTGSAAALEYRASEAPHIGSLYDERLYRLVGPKS